MTTHSAYEPAKANCIQGIGVDSEGRAHLSPRHIESGPSYVVLPPREDTVQTGVESWSAGEVKIREIEPD
ncbi:MAG TPA: hypothetical protein VKM96_06070 [Candidatus Bathyarchaeia archaeon]|nr:hypothetical protein [Candidatus Bathyarchaeia archaeon]